MRKLLHGLIVILHKVFLTVSVCAVVLYTGSYLFEFHSAQPWPSWLPSSQANSSTDTYFRVDIDDGEFSFSQIRPLEYEQALANRLNPFPVGGYRSWNLGLVPTDGVWYPLGASNLRRISLNPWAETLFLMGITVVLWLIRRISNHWMTVKQRSQLCLHCGKNFSVDDIEDTCKQCGATRPMVTVSSAG